MLVIALAAAMGGGFGCQSGSQAGATASPSAFSNGAGSSDVHAASPKGRVVAAPASITAFAPRSDAVVVDAYTVNYRQLFEDLGPDATLWYQHVHSLANPFFEGRLPGTRGSALTAEYIEFYFRSYGAFNVHDLMDGIAIGAAILTDPALGIVVFLAVLLHELPAGFAVGTIIRNYGGSRTQAMLAGLSIGLVTLVGILIPFAIGEVNESAASMLLGVAGGTFIYIGASILIPTAETGRYRWSFVYVALGFAMFAGTAEIAGRIAGA